MRVIEVFMYGRRCAYYHSFLQERKRGGTPSLNFAAAKIGIIDGPFIMAALLLIEDCFSFGGTPILSSIDNLIKGASGQAVQNMNIMYGFDETTGLL